MARQLTAGAESLDATLEGVSLSGTTTMQGTVKRSGTAAFKCDSGAGNAAAFVASTTAGATTGTRISRGFFNLPALPSAGAYIQTHGTSGGGFGALLSTGGKLRLVNLATSTQIGSDSVETVAINTWFRVEILVTIVAAGGNDTVELRLNGTTVASSSGTNITDALGSAGVAFGWGSAPGASKIIYVDDIAVNDDTGSAQNTWPGDGSVILLVPNADVRRDTKWTAGAGGTTNLYQGVDNLPPQGVASALESNTTNIEHAGGATVGNETYMGSTPTFASSGATGSDVAFDVDDNYASAISIGNQVANTRIGQKFVATGGWSAIDLSLAYTGSPADSLIVEIQSDNGSGAPSGTVLVSTTVAPASMGTNYTRVSLTALAYAGVNGTTYHVVLRRSVANDGVNYFYVKGGYNGYGSLDLPYTYGMRFNNGTSWGSESTQTTVAFRARSTTASSTVTLVQMVGVVGEDVATGTKLLTLATGMNPLTYPDLSFDVAPTSGAHGTYPTGWFVRRGAVFYSPWIEQGLATRVRAVRPETATRVACVCFLGLLVEYVPPAAPSGTTYTQSVGGTFSITDLTGGRIGQPIKLTAGSLTAAKLTGSHSPRTTFKAGLGGSFASKLTGALVDQPIKLLAGGLTAAKVTGAAAATKVVVQTMAGTIANTQLAAVVVRLAKQNGLAGGLTAAKLTATATKTAYRPSLAGSLAGKLSGTLVEQPIKVLAGALTAAKLTATLVRATTKILAGTIANTQLAGLLARTAQKVVAGSIAAAKLVGAYQAVVAKVLAATLAGRLAGALLEQTTKVLAGSLTAAKLAGAAVSVKVGIKAVTGTLANTQITATLVRVSTKLTAGTLSSSGAVLRQARRLYGGTLTTAGAVLKRPSQSLTSAFTPSGAVAMLKVAVKTLAGAITPAGALLRQTRASYAGSLTAAKLTGALSSARNRVVSMAGALAPTGALAKKPVRLVAGTLTAAGSLVSRMAKQVAGSLATAATLSAQRVTGTQNLTLGGTLTTAATLVRRAQKPLQGAVAPVGALVGRTAKTTAGVVAPGGALARLTLKATGGTVATAGVVARSAVRTLAGILSTVGDLLQSIGQLTRTRGRIHVGDRSAGGPVSHGTRLMTYGVAGDRSAGGPLTVGDRATGLVVVGDLTQEY